LNDEENAVFSRNKRISQLCGVSAAAIIPWWLISMLSLKYDHARWMKQLRISSICLFTMGGVFNYVCS